MVDNVWGGKTYKGANNKRLYNRFVTSLMYACQQNRDSQVRELLAQKSDIRQRDRTMKSALHYCVENSSSTSAELVLAAAPELLDAKDKDGFTPLHLAIIAGNLSLVRFLLHKRADLSVVDNEKHSVVHWATVCGELEALEALLESGADPSMPDIHNGYPIHYAAQMCGPHSEMGTDVKVGLKMLAALLARKVDVNVVDSDGRQPILWAASAGSADAVLSLINAGAAVEAADKDGLTALHCAASRGHTECLETLITLCGADVNVIDNHGCTALFYAVTLGHADCTHLLLNFGANCNTQDRRGRTAAHCGAAKGQLETLKLLHMAGADLWQRNVRGDLPLHDAVQSGRRELVRWLLALRPEMVTAANSDGCSSLHIAAIRNYVEMCRVLLDAESFVNPVMRTSKGALLTPLDAALAKENRSCAKYLQLLGGVPASKLTEEAAALRGQRKAQIDFESQMDYLTPRLDTNLSTTSAVLNFDTSGANTPALQPAPIQVTQMSSLQVEAENVAEKSEERSKSSHRSARKARTRKSKSPRSSSSESETELKEKSAKSSRTKRKSRRNSSRREKKERQVDEEIVEGETKPGEVIDVKTDAQSKQENHTRHAKEASATREKIAKSTLEQESPVALNAKPHITATSELPNASHEEQSNQAKAVGTVGSKSSDAKEDKLKGREVGEKRAVRDNNNKIKEDATKKTKSNGKSSNQQSLQEKSEQAVSDNKVEIKVYPKVVIDSPNTSGITTDSEAASTGSVESCMEITAATEKDNLKKTKIVEKASGNKASKNGEVPKEAAKKAAPARAPSKDKGGEKKVTKTKAAAPENKAKKETAKTEEISQKVKKVEIHEVQSKNEQGITTQSQPVSKSFEIANESKVQKKVENEEIVEAQIVSSSSGEQKEEKTKDEKATEEIKTEKIIEVKNNDEKTDVKIEFKAPLKEIQAVKEQHIEKETQQGISVPSIAIIPGIPAKQEEQEEKPPKEAKPKVTVASENSVERKIELVQEEVLFERESVKEQNSKAPEVAEKNDSSTAPLGSVVDKGTTKQQKQPLAASSSKGEDGDEKSRINTTSENASGDTNKARPAAVTETPNTQIVVNQDESEAVSQGGDTTETYDDTSRPLTGATVSETTSDFRSGESEGKSCSESETKDEKPAATKKQTKEITKRKSETTSDVSATEDQTHSDSTHISSENRHQSSPKKALPKHSTKKEHLANKSLKAEGKREAKGKHKSCDILSSDEGQKPRVADTHPEEGRKTVAFEKADVQPHKILIDGKQLINGKPSQRVTPLTKMHAIEQSAQIEEDEKKAREIIRKRHEQSVVSVTQAVQVSTRKYQLERRIFQELLELKKAQLRAGRGNESILVKRAVDEYRKEGLIVGLRQYDGPYSFRAFEQYLYDQLKLLQNSSDARIIARLKPTDDVNSLAAALRLSIPRNVQQHSPAFCTISTHRCKHATDAYTTPPVANYVNRLPQTERFLPQIGSPPARHKLVKSSTLPATGTMKHVDIRQPMTLELSLGGERQIVALPTDKLDRSKRYYVSFSIKPKHGQSDSTDAEVSEEKKQDKHKHATTI
ncbi:inversin isoform X2 [Neocloeon triangulifer]|uniref:inversin isoform X2 n=1 Tax=Neocloeon triangulifer TaxID=2078957 RepID=UPI00286FA5B7|nr:inversin isoform X2 [Neocloeon triangulifer]